MASLPELFEAAGNQLGGTVGEFFTGTAVQMAAVTGRPLQTAMRFQLEACPLPLSQEETAMLLELAGALGRYDLVGQARALELYKRRMEQQLELLRSQEQQKGRAYAAASVCGGLALILVLL